MESDKINDLAVKSADRFELSPEKDEWHSHYYGFTFGMQEGIKLGQELPKGVVGGCLLPTKSQIEKIVEDDYKLQYGTNGTIDSLIARKEGAKALVNWILNNR